MPYFLFLYITLAIQKGVDENAQNYSFVCSSITLSPTLMEQQRLRACEKGVLRRKE
jgi:hypothetical protein